jgi:hypothetical protein
MVAFPDEYGAKIQDGVPATGYRPGDALRRAVLMCLGAAFLMSAIGLWMMPAEPGDHAIRLIKLLVSVVAVGGGLTCLACLGNDRADPELHVDHARSELRIIQRDDRGIPRVVAHHPLDSLRAATLDDGFFSVQDAGGKELISVRVTDRRVRDQLCRVFDLRA